MILKDYIIDHGLSIYRLAKDSEIPYSTLNDLENNKVMIENCKAGDVERVAHTLGVSMENLMNMCRETYEVKEDNYCVTYRIFAENKAYYVQFSFNGNTYTIKLCLVNKQNSNWVNDLAKWAIEDTLAEIRLEEINYGLHHELYTDAKD